MSSSYRLPQTKPNFSKEYCAAYSYATESPIKKLKSYDTLAFLWQYSSGSFLPAKLLAFLVDPHGNPQLRRQNSNKQGMKIKKL